MIHLPRTQERINVSTRDRLRSVERKSVGDQRPQEEELAVYSAQTPTVPTVWSALPGYPVRRGGQVVGVVCSAGTAGAGSSTFKVRQNGTVIGSTLTFPASTTAPTTLYLGDIRVPGGVLLHLEPVTIGSGLLGFTAVIVMKG